MTNASLPNSPPCLVPGAPLTLIPTLSVVFIKVDIVISDLDPPLF